MKKCPWIQDQPGTTKSQVMVKNIEICMPSLGDGIEPTGQNSVIVCHRKTQEFMANVTTSKFDKCLVEWQKQQENDLEGEPKRIRILTYRVHHNWWQFSLKLVSGIKYQSYMKFKVIFQFFGLFCTVNSLKNINIGYLSVMEGHF